MSSSDSTLVSRAPSSEDKQKKPDLRAELAIIFNKYNNRLTTLPNEKCWFSETLYLYQGFWKEGMGVATLMATQDTFKPQSTDIYLPSLPKSGTTWLKALAFAIVNRDKYKNNETHPLKISNPHICVPNIETHILFNIFEDGHSPRIFGTHMPYTSLPRSVIESDCRMVYVYRNPKDVLVSLFHFTNKLKEKSHGDLMTFEEAFEVFSKGVIPSGPYWDHVKGYYMASLDHPTKILFLKYEDLQMNTVNEVKRLAGFLGYPFGLEEEEDGVVQQIIKLCDFKNLKEVDKDGKLGGVLPANIFFRKGKVGDWTNHLTNEMSQVLDEITEEKFHGLDISF